MTTHRSPRLVVAALGAAVVVLGTAGCSSPLLATLEGHSGPVEGVVFSPDAARIASGSGDGSVRLWSPDGDALQTIDGLGGPVSGVTWSPRGNVLASSGDDGKVRLFSAAGGHPLRTIAVGRGDVPASVAFSPDGDELAAGNAAGTVAVWAVANGRRLRTLARREGPVAAVAWSADGSLLATAGLEGAEIRDAEKGKIIHILETRGRGVRRPEFSARGDLLAIGHRDGEVLLFTTADGALAKALPGHAGPVHDVAFSPDGALVASAGEDGSVRVFRVEDGVALAAWTGHDGAVLSLAFAPDGALLATGGLDGTVRLWRVGAW